MVDYRSIWSAEELAGIKRRQRDVTRAWRHAVSPLLDRGWSVDRGMRAISTQTGTGTGRILLDPQTWGDPLGLSFGAVASSAFLVAAVGRPPVRPGRLTPKDTHAGIAPVDVGYSDTPGLGGPVDAWSATGWIPRLPPGPILDPGHLGPWMDAAIAAMAAWATEAVTDEGMLAVLTAGRQTVATARYAAVLARHLGREDEVARLVELGAVLLEERDAIAFGRGATPEHYNRSRFMGEWSHDRFVRFLAKVRPGAASR